MFTIPKRLIPIRTLSTFIAILLANCADLHADDPAAWNQLFVEQASKVFPDKPSPAEIESAFSLSTPEDERLKVLSQMFAQIDAEDMPLSQLMKTVQDHLVKSDIRVNAAYCLVKIVCGKDPGRSILAESALFDELRNVKNDLELRANIAGGLAMVTQSPHILLSDLIWLIQDPDAPAEQFEIAQKSINMLVSYRQVISREAAWSALRTAYRGTEPKSHARERIAALMPMISHFPSAADPASRQLLSDAEKFAAEVFCDTRNAEKLRENATMGVGVYFRVHADVLQTANYLLEAETTSEKLRAQCNEIVVRATKSDLTRNLELSAFCALSKGMSEMMRTPPITQK